jgi:hypothetical protein
MLLRPMVAEGCSITRSAAGPNCFHLPLTDIVAGETFHDPAEAANKAKSLL